MAAEGLSDTDSFQAAGDGAESGGGGASDDDGEAFAGDDCDGPENFDW